MVTDAYETLLQEIGEVLKIPNLHADPNNSCLIRYPEGIEVQIEIDREENHLLVAASLGSLPAGRYRDGVLIQALKANGLPPPRHGTLAFNGDEETLVLFKLFPLKNLRGDKVADFIPPFVERALKWQNDIKNGNIPAVEGSSSAPSSGLFGLRP